MDVQNGEVIGSEVMVYPDCVIDTTLPGSQTPLPPDFALQNPADWLTTLEATTRKVLQTTGTQPDQVIGIGIDFLASTILTARKDGAPLCQLDAFRAQPYAWPMLWKHHAAQPQADRIVRLAEERSETWLQRYGGKISSEWLPSKALSILEHAHEVYEAADVLIEAADWVGWQLTGQLAHNACGAGYKGLWNEQDGFPSSEYLAMLNPGFSELYKKLPGPVLAPGIVPDTTNTCYRVDMNDTAANKMVLITRLDPRDAVGDTNGRVCFRILDHVEAAQSKAF